MMMEDLCYFKYIGVIFEFSAILCGFITLDDDAWVV